MGLDLRDDSLKGTPNRVAKMYINEIFFRFKFLLTSLRLPYSIININTTKCWLKRILHSIRIASITFVPIIGKAHVAYISSGKVIGLSKLNRIVQFYAQKASSAGAINESNSC